MATELGEGLWQFQAPLWQTNSLLALIGSDTLVCDPAYSVEEIESIRAEATRRGDPPAWLLLTHADFDHTCGIGFFPESEVIAGSATAEAVASGAAADQLRGQAAEWGEDWPDDLRVDRIVEAEEGFDCGPFRVLAVDSPGHTADGLAFLLLDQGVLLPGDYLSTMTFPYATSSIEATIATTRRLLALLSEHEPRWVVPGHGPALEAEGAAAVGREDVAYLEGLLDAARDARDRGLSPGHALLAAFAVPPPRATTPDFEVYGLRAANARQALDEVR